MQMTPGTPHSASLQMTGYIAGHMEVARSRQEDMDMSAAVGGPGMGCVRRDVATLSKTFL